MGRFFDLDSPIMRGLSIMADLICLNLIVLVLCIPVVTAGAAFTAMHYVLLKIVRNEEGYLLKGFFKSFRQNFAQSTGIWIIELIVVALFAADIKVMNSAAEPFPLPVVIAILAAMVILLLTSIYIFPLQARFENKVIQTFKNAFIMMVLHLPKTILMAIMYAFPVFLILLSNYAMPLLIMFCFSLPAFGSAYIYSGIFKKFEPEKEAVDDMDFSIDVSEEETNGEDCEE